MILKNLKKIGMKLEESRLRGKLERCGLVSGGDDESVRGEPNTFGAYCAHKESAIVRAE